MVGLRVLIMLLRFLRFGFIMLILVVMLLVLFGSIWFGLVMLEFGVGLMVLKIFLLVLFIWFGVMRLFCRRCGACVMRF